MARAAQKTNELEIMEQDPLLRNRDRSFHPTDTVFSTEQTSGRSPQSFVLISTAKNSRTPRTKKSSFLSSSPTLKTTAAHLWSSSSLLSGGFSGRSWSFSSLVVVVLLVTTGSNYSDALNHLTISLFYTKETKKIFRGKREHLRALLLEKDEEKKQIEKGIIGLKIEKKRLNTASDVISKRIGKRQKKVKLLEEEIIRLTTAADCVDAALDHLTKTPSELKKAVVLAKKLVGVFDDSDDGDEGPSGY